MYLLYCMVVTPRYTVYTWVGKTVQRTHFPSNKICMNESNVGLAEIGVGEMGEIGMGFPTKAGEERTHAHIGYRVN